MLPDVQAARDRFKPTQYKGLGVSARELRQGVPLVEEALDHLGEPHIFVNRSLEDAVHLLRDGGHFSTIHDLPNKSEEVEAYLEGRTAHEKRLGTYGEGPLQGRTVYGSLGFSEKLSPELWEDGLLHPEAKPPKQHLNAGIELTGGPVTFVLKPEANEHATFLPSDTYDTRGELPVAREHLAYAIWANIGSKGDSYFNGDEGSQALLKLPHDQAVHAVERFLTSDAINRGYMEAQVRGASRDEVERIVVRTKEALAAVKPLAAELGIPCQFARP